jgi:hypothetical protein
MATVATTIIPLQKTVTATAAAIARGTRVTLNSSGLVAASAIGVRGDYIMLESVAASGTGLAAVINAGGSLPVLAGEASCDRGDAAYTMASGLSGITNAGGAIYLGKWLQTTANGALGVIELAPVA